MPVLRPNRFTQHNKNVFLERSSFGILILLQLQFHYINILYRVIVIGSVVGFLPVNRLLFVYCVGAYCCSVLREEGNGR